MKKPVLTVCLYDYECPSCRLVESLADRKSPRCSRCGTALMLIGSSHVSSED